MFAARQIEDKFYLCRRKGKAFTVIEGKQVHFPDVKSARDCARELNEKYLDEYDALYNRDGVSYDKDNHTPDKLELREKVWNVVKKHGAVIND